MRPARHDLIWLSEAGWDALAGRRPDLRALPAIRAWIDAGFPIMARRSSPGDDPSMWPAAIALPPPQGQLRLSLEVMPDEVHRTAPPPFLRDALDDADAMPAPWRPRLDAVLRLGDRIASQPRMFGSLMWQTVTGLPYLRSGSDIDLLWQLETWGHDAASRLPELLDGLRALDEGIPRLDGEVLFGRSGGVQWREWAGPTDTVLLKTDAEARLVPRAALAAWLGAS